MNYILMSPRLLTKLWMKKTVRHLPESLLNEGELSKWHKRGSGKIWLECLMRTRNSKIAVGEKKTHSPVFGPKAPGM